MTYTVANMLRASDPASFVEIFNRVARPELEAGGSTKLRVSQTIFGGEFSGAITMAADFESVSAAAAAVAAANAKAGPEAREAGVELVSRSLVITREQRGEQDGEYGSLLQVTSSPTSAEQMSANADLYWSHMSAGCSGQRFGQMIAAGERTGRQVAITWTEDLDALTQASAAMFAHPEVQQLNARFDVVPVSRSLFRRLA
jgi:hypothetical protein